MEKVDFADEILGQIVYNEQLNWYDGEILVDGLSLKFHLDADENKDINFLLDKAKKVFSDFPKYKSGAEDYAVSKLLDLKNDVWIDDDEEPFDAEKFKAAMTLESLVFYESGEVTFYHDDGDLFWGHTIEIRMNGGDEFYHAGIAG